VITTHHYSVAHDSPENKAFLAAYAAIDPNHRPNFMAVGGYTSAILIHHLGFPYWATIPIAALLSGLVGFLFGLPALRLSGIYLALATFALAVSTPTFIQHFDRITLGHEGINLPGVRPPDFIPLSDEQWAYYVALALALALFAFAWNLVRSRAGRAFMAVRDSETAAVANGIDVAFHKTLAFALSAFYAGVAGSLVALATGFVNPDTYDLPLSIALLVGVVVGGVVVVSRRWSETRAGRSPVPLQTRRTRVPTGAPSAIERACPSVTEHVSEVPSVRVTVIEPPPSALTLPRASLCVGEGVVVVGGVLVPSFEPIRVRR